MNDTMPLDGTEAKDVVVAFRKEYKDLEARLKVLRDSMPRGEASRYVSLAYTELESSRHWLGEALGALGEPSPYEQ